MCSLLFELHWGEQTLALQAYPVLAMLSACLVLVLGSVIAIERGLPWKNSLACLLTSAPAFLIGARLLHIAANLSFYQEGTYHLLGMRGFSLTGGLLGAAAAGLVSCRFWRVDWWRLADAVAPGLGAGIALMRIGCFLNGCCYGKATTLPWAVTFPPEIIEPVTAVHPTQLYEAAAALAGTVLAAWLLRRGAVHGAAFLAFSLWFLFSHWLIGYLRASASAPGFPLFISASLLASLFITAAVLLYLRLKHQKVHSAPGTK